ncbi:MAG: type II secretion system F family protein [Acidobacteriota bacterium]
MSALIILAAVVWLASMAGWFVVSKYFKSSDAVRIKERLTGVVKTGAKKKSKDGSSATASVMQTQQSVKNKFAQLLVEKYQLGPKITIFLEQAGLSKWTPARLVHLCLMAFSAGVGVAWLILSLPVVIAVVIGFIASVGPVGYVWWLRKGRLHRFEELFPETLEFISRSMRAGHAFSVSLEMIYREFQEPIAGEFRRTFEEHNLGLPIETALQKFATRVPSLDVHFFVSAVLLQKRTGGNLAEILDKLAYIIRERFKLRGRIRAVSAHGKMTASTLSSIPIGVGVLMFYTNPDYVAFFFTDEVGQMMLAAAVFLQLVGYLIMRKIVNIEV